MGGWSVRREIQEVFHWRMKGRNVMSDYMPGSPIYGGNVDLSSTANGIVTIPDGQELVLDGMPHLQKTRKENCGYRP